MRITIIVIMMMITLLDNTITGKTSSFHCGLTIFQTTIITNLNRKIQRKNTIETSIQIYTNNKALSSRIPIFVFLLH